MFIIIISCFSIYYLSVPIWRLRYEWYSSYDDSRVVNYELRIYSLLFLLFLYGDYVRSGAE